MSPAFMRPLLAVTLVLLSAFTVVFPSHAQSSSVVATTLAETAVYVEPNPDADLLATLAPDTALSVNAQTTANDGTRWLRTLLAQRQGWIAREAVVLTGDLSTVPVIQPVPVLDDEIQRVLAPLQALLAPLQDMFGERYAPQIYLDAQDVPPGRVTIVFSAGIHNAAPNQLGLDRLDTAIALYEAGLTDHLHMAGNSREHLFDQPGVMADYALARGVPAAAITVDREAFTTGETCRRARAVFAFDQVVLVSQAYHLPRALLLCEAAGLDAVGLAADRRVYANADDLQAHERFALPLAVFDVLTQGLLAGEPQDE